MSTSKRVMTHGIVVARDECDATAALAVQKQTQSLDALTVIGHSSLLERFPVDSAAQVIEASVSNPIAALSAALGKVTSDVVLFLRAGDVWSPHFVARMKAIYENNPDADVVTCDASSGASEPSPNDKNPPAIDLGFSAVATYAYLDYVTLPLSCFTVRRRIVERILPLVDDPDWQNAPQACLSVAASLASAHSYHLPIALVTANGALEVDAHSDLAYRLKRMRLVGKTANQLRLNPDFVKQFLVMEYSSRPKDPATIIKYSRLLQTYLPDTRSRRRILLSMYRKMKDHLHGTGSFSSHARRWWLKQRLRWTGKLAV